MLNILNPAEWVSVSTYQAIGLVCSICISFGRNLTGPQIISKIKSSEILVEYENSIKTQLTMLLISSIIFIFVQFLISSDNVMLKYSAFLSIASIGVRANWLYIGLDRQLDSLKRETSPKLVANLSGLISMVATNNVFYFFLFQSIGTFISIVLTYLWIKKRFISSTKFKLSYIHLIKSDAKNSLPYLINAITSFAPLFILQVTNIKSAAVLALFLRLRMQFFTVMSPFMDSIISTRLVQQSKAGASSPIRKFIDSLQKSLITAILFPLFALGISYLIKDSEVNYSHPELLLFSLYVGSYFAWQFAYSTESVNVMYRKLVILSLVSLFGMIVACFVGLNYATLSQTFVLIFINQVVTLILFVKNK
jgi:hypothetical protein